MDSHVPDTAANTPSAPRSSHSLSDAAPPPDARPEVAITGIGLATGLGATREATWTHLRAGEHAIRRLRGPGFIGRNGPCFGARVPEIPSGGIFRGPTLVHRLTKAALKDANFGRNTPDPERTGAAVGLSKGWISGLATFLSQDGSARATRERSYAQKQWTNYWPYAAVHHVASRGRAAGASLAPVAACATGLVAVLQGADLIRRDLCDVVFAGAVDASLHPLILAAFDRMGALSRVNPDLPGRSIRPWDRRRRGFLLGEGGAIFVLERLDHALARGRSPYAVVAGGALGSDAYHLTDLDPDPTTLAGVIRRAIDDARLAPDDIDHVNVHGTATRSNDPLECRALRMALGPAADGVSCSANKPQIGHTLGAAGAVELAITCLAIRDQFVPPTLNLEDPDPACDLDGTPGTGRPREIRAALKLSLGFGGHLAAVVLTRPDPR